MTDPSAPPAGRAVSPPSGGRVSNDKGWGPSTNVRAGSSSRPVNAPPGAARDSRVDQDSWTPAGPLSGREQRATRRAERNAPGQDRAYGDGYAGRPANLAVPRARERGLPWWAALLVLIAIAAVGGIIDTAGSNGVSGGFNIGIVVASVVAILIVKRSHMFPVVIAPPIVYSVATVFQLYVRSSGLHDKKVVFDAAANYLVYGFPAIAAATAAVLIIAGIRLIIRK